MGATGFRRWQTIIDQHNIEFELLHAPTSGKKRVVAQSLQLVGEPLAQTG